MRVNEDIREEALVRYGTYVDGKWVGTDWAAAPSDKTADSQVHGADTQAAKDAGKAASGFVRHHLAVMNDAQQGDRSKSASDDITASDDAEALQATAQRQIASLALYAPAAYEREVTWMAAKLSGTVNRLAALCAEKDRRINAFDAGLSKAIKQLERLDAFLSQDSQT